MRKVKFPLMPINPYVASILAKNIGVMLCQELKEEGLTQTWSEKSFEQLPVMDGKNIIYSHIFRIDDNFIYHYTMTRTYRYKHNLSFLTILKLCSEMRWAQVALEDLK